MKTTFKIIAIVAATFFTLDSMAQTGTTVEGFPACVTDASLDTFVSAIQGGDNATLVYYINTGTCIVMSGGHKVYGVDYYDWLTKVKFRFEGATLYSLQEGVKLN